jgi:hypothetical protein
MKLIEFKKILVKFQRINEAIIMVIVSIKLRTNLKIKIFKMTNKKLSY